MTYTVENTLGTRTFTREDDAYDYAIKIMRQAGIRSKITTTNQSSED